MCKPSDPRRLHLADQSNASERHLIIMPTFVDVPEIKLIRTDTTLDLSQKAEKVCFKQCSASLMNPFAPSDPLWGPGICWARNTCKMTLFSTFFHLISSLFSFALKSLESMMEAFSQTSAHKGRGLLKTRFLTSFFKTG